MNRTNNGRIKPPPLVLQSYISRENDTDGNMTAVNDEYFGLVDTSSRIIPASSSAGAKPDGIPTAPVVAGVPTPVPPARTTFEDLLEQIGSLSWFQLLLFVLLLPAALASFMLLTMFSAQQVPHYCRAPGLWPPTELGASLNSWSNEQRRNLSIPNKPTDRAPAIGQSYESCVYYDLPYEQYVNLSFEEALTMRDMMDGDKPLKTLRCNQWNFDYSTLDFHDSIQAEWTLVCEREALLPLSRTVYAIGHLGGLGIAGVTGDRLGRKPTIIISAALTIAAGLLSVFPTDYYQYLVTQALVAAACNGFFISCFVMLIENITVRHRTLIGYLYLVPFHLTYGYIAFFAWLTQNWRYLQLSMNLVLVICLLYPCLLPESPRWLVQKGRFRQAARILSRAARMNGRRKRRSMAANDDVGGNFNASVRMLQHSTSHVGESAAGEPQRVGIAHKITSWFAHAAQLFTSPELRTRTLCSCWLWFSFCLVWYGLMWYAAELKGANQFIIITCQGLLAIPVLAISYLLNRMFGGRRVMMGFTLGSAACLLTVAVIDTAGGLGTNAILVTVLATLGKCMNDGAFAALYVYTPEIFPTLHRNSGIGTSSMAARVGSMLSPFAKHLSNTVWHPLPLLVFGLLSMSASLLLYFMPETHGRALDETREGVEKKNTI